MRFVYLEEDLYATNPVVEMGYEEVSVVTWHGKYNLGNVLPREKPLAWLPGFASQWLTKAQLRRAGCRVRRSDSVAEAMERWVEDRLDSPEYSHRGGRWDLFYDTLDAVGLHYKRLSLYDHSGISLYVGSPSCQWDSGYVGLAFLPPVKRDKEGRPTTGIQFKGGINPMFPPPDRVAEVDKVLESILSELSMYHRGDNWSVVEFDTEKAMGVFDSKRVVTRSETASALVLENAAVEEGAKFFSSWKEWLAAIRAFYGEENAQ